MEIFGKKNYRTSSITSKHAYSLGFLEGEGEVVSPVLRLQTEPVEVVRIEDVDQGTEGQTVIPVGRKICHRNLKLFRQRREL